MRINHNIAAMNTYNKLTANTAATAKSLEKLSSGLKINRAGDNAAGLAISEKMRAQVRGLDQANTNAQDGVSLIQTAEGALNETHSILQRMRELAVQSANDTNTNSDRAEIQKEVDELAKEITRIANTTEFNTQNLLNGGIQSGNLGEMKLHIGANEGQNLNFSITAMDAKTLGVTRDTATASVSAATDVTAASVSGGLGAGIVNGAVLTLSASVTTHGTVGATGAIGGITYATAKNSDTLNGYTLTVANGAAAGSETATIDATAKTITLTIADAAGAKSTAAQINTALNSALTAAGINDVTFAATGTVTDNAGTGSGAITGGAQDQVTLSLTDGTLTETTVVNGNATSASFTAATSFKGLSITLDGNISSGVAGASTTATAATITMAAVRSTGAGFLNGAKTSDASVAAGIDVSSQSAANSAITSIQTAIETVSAERAKMGALQNRLEHTSNNLSTSSENMSAAEGRIRDVDMAKEMMEFQKYNILNQASTAMLAQANQQPQGVLQLLQ